MWHILIPFNIKKDKSERQEENQGRVEQEANEIT